MLRKSTLLAVAASAVLGLAMISTGASAKGHGGGGGGFHGGGHGGHGGGHGMHGGHGGHHFHHGHLRDRHWRHHYVRWHRPIWYARPVVYGAYSAPQVAGPCTCLSKEYTPEGAVLFKDRCSNETAMNPPAVAPQQTGALDQQPQAYSQQYVQPQPAVQYPPQANTAAR